MSFMKLSLNTDQEDSRVRGMTWVPPSEDLQRITIRNRTSYFPLELTTLDYNRRVLDIVHTGIYDKVMSVNKKLQETRSVFLSPAALQVNPESMDVFALIAHILGGDLGEAVSPNGARRRQWFARYLGVDEYVLCEAAQQVFEIGKISTNSRNPACKSDETLSSFFEKAEKLLSCFGGDVAAGESREHLLVLRRQWEQHKVFKFRRMRAMGWEHPQKSPSMAGATGAGGGAAVASALHHTPPSGSCFSFPPTAGPALGAPAALNSKASADSLADLAASRRSSNSFGSYCDEAAAHVQEHMGLEAVPEPASELDAAPPSEPEVSAADVISAAENLGSKLSEFLEPPELALIKVQSRLMVYAEDLKSLAECSALSREYRQGERYTELHEQVRLIMTDCYPQGEELLRRIEDMAEQAIATVKVLDEIADKAAAEGSFAGPTGAVALQELGSDLKELMTRIADLLGAFPPNSLTEYLIETRAQQEVEPHELWTADIQGCSLFALAREARQTSLAQYVALLWFASAEGGKDGSGAKEDVFDAATCRAVGLSARTLRGAGYSAAELKSGGYEIQHVLHANYTVAEAEAGGFTAAALRATGRSVGELLTMGFSETSVLSAGFSAAELRAGGLSKRDVVGSGQFSVSDLRLAGMSAGDLRANGFSASELQGAGFSASELRLGGYNIKVLRKCGFFISELRAAGFTALEQRALNCTAADLLSVRYAVAELRCAGFTTLELRAANCTVAELRNAKYTNAEIAHAGYPPKELRANGIPTRDLRAARYAAADLLRAGYTCTELHQGGYPTSLLPN